MLGRFFNPGHRSRFCDKTPSLGDFLNPEYRLNFCIKTDEPVVKHYNRENTYCNDGFNIARWSISYFAAHLAIPARFVVR